MLAIDVQGLRKEFKVHQSREGLKGAMRDLFRRQYKHVLAVDDIDLQIPQGEICGYIGENGAGKSTTIKMMTGILMPTAGSIRVHGMVPYAEREQFVRHIGVVFGQRSQLWWDIAVMESFRLLRKIYRVEAEVFKRRLDELVERLELAEILNRPVRKLSLGQRMRCELAAALLHNPAIVFLDEPTIGLDIVVKTEIRRFLQDMNKEHGTTILLTTHDLQDIEALCSRVVMLDGGKIIFDDSLEQLKRTWTTGKSIHFKLAHAANLSQLQRLVGDKAVWTLTDPRSPQAWVERQADISAVIASVAAQMEVLDIQIIERGTDDIVREIYQSGSRQEVNV